MSHKGKWGWNVWLFALLTPTLGGGKWPFLFRCCLTRVEADICTDCAGSLGGTRANPDVCRRFKSHSPVGNGATIFVHSVRSVVAILSALCRPLCGYSMYEVTVCMRLQYVWGYSMYEVTVCMRLQYVWSFSLLNTVRVIKSRRIRWAGHVARMGDRRGVYWVWWGNRRERDHLGDSRV